MDKQRLARIRASQVAEDDTLGASVSAAKLGNSSMPARDEALNMAKLSALHVLLGEARVSLSKEFERIDRRHYCHHGVSRVEYRREVMEAIGDWV